MKAMTNIKVIREPVANDRDNNIPLLWRGLANHKQQYFA